MRCWTARCGSSAAIGAMEQAGLPPRSSRRSSGWAASGARSGSSGRHRGSTPRRWATRGGSPPNPTYEEVCSGRTGHAEVVLVAFDAAVTSYEEMLKLFWEGHDPTEGMRQGNDVGTQYRSVIVWAERRPAPAGGGLAGRLPADALRSGPRGDHHRDDQRPTTPTGAPVLLRGGLPPAVPREEPRGLLRAWGAPGWPAQLAWRLSSRRQRPAEPDRSRGLRVVGIIRQGWAFACNRDWRVGLSLLGKLGQRLVSGSRRASSR